MLSLMLVGLAFLGQAEATPNPVADLGKKVDRLFRQLSDKELAKREAAEKELVALGADALELLRAKKPVEAEQTLRLARVLRTLENQAAERATKPTTVTLRGEMSLADALKALDEQTGNKVMGAGGRDGKVKVDLEKALYWEALDKILDQAGLTVNPFGGHANTLSLVARPEEEIERHGRAVYSGMFRFEATRLEAVRDVRNPQLRGLRVRLQVSWEPRISPIVLEQPLEQFTAKDDQGRVLAISKRAGSLQAAVQSGISAVDLDVPFELPDRSVKAIGSLKGKLQALVPGSIETFEFPILNKDAKKENVEQKKAGVTVILETVRKNNELTEVRVRIRFDNALQGLDSHLAAWVYNNDAYLLDAKGERVDVATSGATRQSPNEVGMAYLFDLPPNAANYRFVYKTPATLVQLPVEYELTNIELP